jgi:hypothetical protein
MTAPELSFTVPRMPPKVDCAQMRGGNEKRISSRQGRAYFQDECAIPLHSEENCSSDGANCSKKR